MLSWKLYIIVTSRLMAESYNELSLSKALVTRQFNLY